MAQQEATDRKPLPQLVTIACPTPRTAYCSDWQAVHMALWLYAVLYLLIIFTPHYKYSYDIHAVYTCAGVP